MNLIGSFVIAFSMYSRIPMPRMDWTEERMRYALCFFPVIGAVIGAVEIATFALCEILGAGVLFRTCLLTAVPLLITGGIHMDGYLDVTDARHSYGEREKKLVDKMVRSALERIIREPVLRLRQVREEGKREEYIQAVEELFDL